MELHPSIWPAEYVCPISRSVMADPVIVSSGHTYERICIETWLELGQTTCVKQNTPLNRDFVIPNLAVRDAIAKLAISQGMHGLPSPPSPRHARELVKHLISEMHASSHCMQTSDLWQVGAGFHDKQEDPFELRSESGNGQVDADKEEGVLNPDEVYAESSREWEMEGEGNVIHRFSTIGIRDEQNWQLQKSRSSCHSVGYQQGNTPSRKYIDIRHRQSNDVEASEASREQQGGSHGGYNRYTTAAEEDMYLARRQPDSLQTFRVSRKRGDGAHGTHIEIQGDADLAHRQSENVGGFRVSKERSEAPGNRQFDYGGESKDFREEGEGSHDSCKRYARETGGDKNPLHRQSGSVRGFRVSNEQKGISDDDYHCAAAEEDMDLVHRQSDNVQNLRISIEQRESSHNVYSSYPGADGSCGDYGNYSRADGYLTSPIPSRYSHSASGDILLQTSYGKGELPPHLVTKPSSYSATEPPARLMASSASSCMTTSLVEKLQSRLLEVQEAAVIELRHLTRISVENRVSFCCPDLIHALLPHLKSEMSVVQINGVAALVNLSLENQNKVMIVRSGAVPYLVEVLKHGFPEAQEHAAGAVFSLAIADENKDLIGVLNAIPPLVRLLNTGRPGARKDAAMALYQLSLFQSNKSKLVKVGAVPILLNLAESGDMLDLASRVLLIVCNVAAIPEGRASLLEHNAITKLVKLLAVRSNKHVPEQAAAALFLLSKGNRRFKAMASSAGAQELLTVLANVGTLRAREKALALMAIMKESSSGTDSVEIDEMLSRQYLRMNKGRVDGVHMNSSAF